MSRSGRDEIVWGLGFRDFKGGLEFRVFRV